MKNKSKIEENKYLFILTGALRMAVDYRVFNAKLSELNQLSPPISNKLKNIKMIDMFLSLTAFSCI
jgi:hypothetical protein